MQKIMKEKFNSKCERNNNDAPKNFGSSMGVGMIGGISAGLLTPVPAFPQSSEIEDAEVVSIALLDDTNEISDDELIVVDSIVEDEYMAVANNVDDSMSFNQAFAAARANVGPGGLFIWHGNTYGTYYAEEWNNMSAADKEHYWANVHHTTAHINHEMGLIDGTDELEDEYLTTDDSSDFIEDWDNDTDNPDLDLYASDYTDPDIPIDNHMDMSSFA